MGKEGKKRVWRLRDPTEIARLRRSGPERAENASTVDTDDDMALSQTLL